jgi:large subunit ribosomal protein L25
VAENALSVEIRRQAGKGVARKLRAAGRIPGVCYGQGEASVSLTLDPHQLRKLIEKSDAGMNTLFNLAVPGGGSLDGRMVLLRELQKDPVRGAYLHADFYAVNVEEAVAVSVPIHIRGKAKGVDTGGVLDQALRELELECLPLAIPREIAIDVSALAVGDSLHVRDIELPEGVKLISDPNLSVVSVVAPSKEEEPVPVAEVVPGEPGVEGEAAAAPAGEQGDEGGSED